MQQLKIKLQQLGPLRPAAWTIIANMGKETQLKTNESFIRTVGSLAFVSNGLLKEYDAQNRKSPSIINFITANECVVTRKQNQRHYLKACIPTLIYHWDFEDLMHLYQEFNELKLIYDGICAAYDEGIGFRYILLETNNSDTKIKLFLSKYRSILPLLKKKDIANYVHLSYNHFIHAYNNML